MCVPARITKSPGLNLSPEFVKRRQPNVTYCCPLLGNWRNKMLETIAIILLILWALGLVTSYTVGGFIHILLVVAVIMILVRVIQGRKL